MSITLSTNVTVSIGSAMGADVTMSAVTNANPAVATIAGGHAIIVGDYIRITSGWDMLNGRVVRVSAVAVNDITLEGVDTSNTTRYPVGAGVGSIAEVTTWTQLSQLKTLSTSGGDISFADVTSLSDQDQRQMPTVRSPVQMSIEYFDDQSLAWIDEVTTASDARTPYPVMMTFTSGARTVGNAYWSLATIPTVALNEAVTSKIDLSYASTPIRYAT